MAILSRDESELLKQANRRLTLMHKRAKSDLNVENAITFVESDLNIINKGAKTPRFKVTSSMTERQKKSMLRVAEQLIESPYSSAKTTKALYKKQQKTFAQRYGLTKKQAKEMINLFDSKKNPRTANAWQKIKDLTSYDAIVPILKDDKKIGEVQSQIGNEKFGRLMILYTEGGLQSNNYTFADFLSDRDIIHAFEMMSLEEIDDFIENVKQNNVTIDEILVD